MSDSASKPRPQYRNLSVPQILSYHLPLAGKSSIMHRASGALLFLCIPLVILPLFALSVGSPESFASIQDRVANPDRKSVVERKIVSVRVDVGGRRFMKKKKNRKGL